MWIDFLVFGIALNEIESIFLVNFLPASCSAIFNYLMRYFWTFKSEVQHHKTILRYFLNLFFLWMVGTIFLNALIQYGLDPFLAKSFSMCVILPSNYISLRFFVYRN